MTIEYMIIVDQKVTGESSRITVTGQRIYPIKKPLPLILKGVGCIGIATVTQYLVMEDSTRVEFTVNTNISKNTSNALYALYQQRSMDNSDDEDPYDTDTFIPGAMGISNPKPRSRW